MVDTVEAYKNCQMVHHLWVATVCHNPQTMAGASLVVSGLEKENKREEEIVAAKETATPPEGEEAV